MAELKLPVYLRVGSGPEFCVGEVTCDPADPGAILAVPRILRALADEMEAQAAAGRGG